MAKRRLRRSAIALHGTMLACWLLALPATAQNYSYLYRVANFQTWIQSGGSATQSDRFFTSTGFEGLTFTMNTSNVGHFRDGTLRWDAYGTNPARTF